MRKSYKRRPLDFKRRIVKTNITREQLLIEENRYLNLIKKEELGKKYYNLTNFVFNLKKSNGNVSEETKRKISISRQGIKFSDEHKKNLKNSIKNRVLPEESLKNMSKNWFMGEKMCGGLNPFYGKIHTEESRKKISASLLGKSRGIRTEETKRKISESLKGRIRPREVVEKVAATNRGKKRTPHSEETKRKISKAHTGKKLSEEHKMKISNTKKNSKE